MKHVQFFAKLHLFTFYDWQQNIKSEKTEGQMLENHKHFQSNNFGIENFPWGTFCCLKKTDWPFKKA